MGVLYVCLFILFRLFIVFSVLLRFTASGWPFDVFKLFHIPILTWNHSIKVIVKLATEEIGISMFNQFQKAYLFSCNTSAPLYGEIYEEKKNTVDGAELTIFFFYNPTFQLKFYTFVLSCPVLVLCLNNNCFLKENIYAFIVTLFTYFFFFTRYLGNQNPIINCFQYILT